MRSVRVPLLAGVVLLLVAGCPAAPDGDGGGTPQPSLPPTATASTPGQPQGGAAGPTTDPPSGPAEPTGSDWRVIHDWTVPSRPVRVNHPVTVPITPPPGAPLPVLTEVKVGEHPGDNLTRVTFAFRGPTPSYEVAYLAQVPAEGTGDPVPLAGDVFLRIRFEPAQAHDERGRGPAHNEPASPILRSLVPAGDFEGVVAYGFGLARVGADRLPPRVRIGELTRPDGTHIVAVDLGWR